jgi:putative ABC transport system permease protein
MFINYLKIAIRNFFRQKGYSLINIGGLAIGFAAFTLIMFYILNEINYDKFHKDADRIYRVAVKGRMSGDYFDVALSPPPIGPSLKADFPEIEDYTRIHQTTQAIFFLKDDKKFYEENIKIVDSTFFSVFSFDVLVGKPETMLTEPLSVVLTESTARKYFGDEDPMGKQMQFNARLNMKVTGVVKDVPENSHFDYDMLISWSSLEKINPGTQFDQAWGSMSIHTYVKLKPNSDPAVLDEKIQFYILDQFVGLMETSRDDLLKMKMEFIPYLQKLTDIHLHSNKMAEIGTNGDITYVYTFLAIAIFILIIAGINFMNLATAISTKRAKEVGVRKVLGAFRSQLIGQFIAESILICLISFVFSLLIVELFFPFFSQLLGRELLTSFFSNSQLLFSLFGIAILVGLLAGSYPAFYLSAFQPVKVLKGNVNKGRTKSGLRNFLVVLQFSISVFLLIGTGIVYQQQDYIGNKKLGFDKEHIVVIPLRGNRLIEKYANLKEEFKTLPDVKNVSAMQRPPGKIADGTAYYPEGFDQSDPWLIFNTSIDYGYIETMGMDMILGRTFSKNFASDSSAIIINKTLWKKLGWGDDVIGKKMSSGDPRDGSVMHIIGVVDDFHFTSLHKKIEPFVFYYAPQEYRNLAVKLAAGDLKKSIKNLEEKWNAMESSFPFDFYYLEETYGKMYKQEEKLGETFIYFTIIAILIACLGLFGLASFSSEQRRKEIGIRKTLGASTVKLIYMLVKDFTKWVLLSNVIAWPLAYLLLDNWLQNFAYRINILNHWWLFVSAMLISLTIAVATVLFQALKAANANPVESLKYE